MKDEKYIFTIGREILEGRDIINKSFNPSTQNFLLANGLRPGMRVLELACGAGIMTRWIAEKIGQNGEITGIDEDLYQIEAATAQAKNENVENCHFQALSAYDLEQINQPIDLIYCRFLLHHLNDPDTVIAKIYGLLKPNGIFICEEGICSHGFSYPYSDAFQPVPDSNDMPDKNIGKKLYYKLSKAGFKIQKAHIVQPMLISKKEKEMLLTALQATKESFFASGKTEAQWQYLYEETQQLINNDQQIVGFYASCQIASIKV